jgi:hypothetical protein
VNTEIENLRAWSHVLFWISILLPLLGVFAGVARFYIDKREGTVLLQLRKRSWRRAAKFAELKAKTAPRHLTSEQKAAMLDALSQSPPGSVTFVSRLMDGEGSDFANEIGQVFQEAKWTVTFNKTSLNEFRGYVMAFVGVDTAPPETDAMVNSLSAAGIKVEGRKIDPKSVSGLSPVGVAVFIGRQ